MRCLVPFLASLLASGAAPQPTARFGDLFSVRLVTRHPLLFLYEWVIGLGIILTSVIPLAYK